MAEEFRRVFGESAEEVVERERRGDVGEAGSQESGDSAERQGGGGAQSRPRGVQELVPTLCERTSGVVWACEEGAK